MICRSSAPSLVLVLGLSGCFLAAPVAGGDTDGVDAGGVDATVGETDGGGSDGGGADGGADLDGGVISLDAGSDDGGPLPDDAGSVGDDAGGPPTEDAGSPGEDAGPICVGSGVEICDPEMQDEDCDGAFNEGCVCTLGMSQSCTPSSGCVGQEECLGERWGDCIAAPVTALCNGQDDDCDGTFDEGSGCAGATGCVFVVGTGAATGSSYLACVGGRNFTGASARCREFGYELTTIESEPENDWLQTTFNTGVRFWIGLQANAWVSGSDAGYRHSGSPSGNECAVLDTGANDWGGDPCGQTKPFICEAPVP